MKLKKRKGGREKGKKKEKERKQQARMNKGKNIEKQGVFVHPFLGNVLRIESSKLRE